MEAFNFDKNELKIKKLEEEVGTLKKRLDAKSDECMKIWERDSHILCVIEALLKENKLDSKTEYKLKDIMGILQNPGIFMPANHLECEQQIEDLQNTIIVLETRVEQANQEVKMSQTYLKDLEANIEQSKKQNDVDHQVKDSKIKRLQATVLELEQQNGDLEQQKRALDEKYKGVKEEYEKKLLDLMFKIDKLSDENLVRRMQIEKLEKQVLQPSQNENVNKDDQVWHGKEQNYLNRLAKLEGLLLNKDKEMKLVYEKMEFYRKMSKM